jgi:hypothetical protein
MKPLGGRFALEAARITLIPNVRKNGYQDNQRKMGIRKMPM